MKNLTPSLFTFATTITTTPDDGSTPVTVPDLEMTVDLAKITLMSRRPIGGGYYINMGGQSIPLPTEAATLIRNAWIAYQGKFTPGQNS